VRLSVVVVLVCVGLASPVLAEPVWVPFDSVGPTPPTAEIISADPSHVTFQVVAHGMFVEDTVIDGTTFQVLSFLGEGAMTEPGRPQMPQVARLIGLAPSASVSCEVMCEDSVEIAGYFVLPAQYPEVDSDSGPENPFALDSATYGTDAYFPGGTQAATVHELGVWMELGVAVAVIRPLHFNPVQHRLLACRLVTATYTF